MKNSILISKYIIALLKTNTNLSTLVGDKIYPIDAKQGTTFPFIVVKRQNITTNYNKDGISYDNVNFSVIVVSTNYADSVSIAQEVRNTLELYRGDVEYVQPIIPSSNTNGSNRAVVETTTDTLNIKLIHFTNISEDLYNNAFVQQLTFEAIL